jgi:hypothetical protein
MKKIYLVALIPLVLGIGCFITYNVIGAEVAIDGTLIEPFSLLPIGWGLIVLGVACSIILSAVSLFDKE